VFLLDEVDKMPPTSAASLGGPAEFWIPNQNNTFCDQLLDLDYDLSTHFITTATDLQASGAAAERWR